MKLDYEGFCEIGMRRAQNQDTIVMLGDGAQGLFLVADGMGGHSQGERASGELREGCIRWWEQSRSGCTQKFLETVRELKGMLTLAGRRIWEETEPDKVCGAAFVLLWIDGPAYAVLWTGDCRCYQVQRRLWRREALQLTIDDCWENQADLVAGLSQEEIRNHPDFGKLIRAAGTEKNLVCTLQTGAVKSRTLFALCSDGVYRYSEGHSFEGNLKEGVKTGNLKGALEKIRREVYRKQAPDNLSCVLALLTP